MDPIDKFTKVLQNEFFILEESALIPQIRKLEENGFIENRKSIFGANWHYEVVKPFTISYNNLEYLVQEDTQVFSSIWTVHTLRFEPSDDSKDNMVIIWDPKVDRMIVESPEIYEEPKKGSENGL